MATIFEKYTSPRITTGEGGSIERMYGITGEDDEADALALLQATAPEMSGGLPRQSVRLEPIGPDVWDGEAVYAANPPPGGSTPPETGQSSFGFDIGSETQRLTQAKEHIESYAIGAETPKDFGGAINVTDDAVEGVDVLVPTYQFSETHYIDSTIVDNPAYRGAVFALVGKTNDAAFRGFQAGEVLFLGATGSKRGGPEGEDYEVSFRFAASPNRTGLAVGEIEDIDKKGWEYLWIRYEDQEDEDAGGIVKRPVSAHVERVYDEGSFSALGIGVL